MLLGQVKNFDANSVFIIALMVVIFITLINAFLFFHMTRPWLKAFMSGAPISFAELVAMKMRRSNVKAIVDCYIMSTQAKAKISLKDLDAAFHSGADIELVTRAYIEAKKTGKELTLEEIIDASRAEKLEELLRENRGRKN